MSKKFRDKLLESSCVSNKKVESDIGKLLLEQMGWSKDKGLGKNLDGITDCVQVERKNELEGLGFINENIKEVEENWWEKIYNNSISKININPNKNNLNKSLSNYDTEDEDYFDEFSNIVYKKKNNHFK